MSLGLRESSFLRLEYSVELLVEYSNTQPIPEVAGAKQTATCFLVQVCNKYNNGSKQVKIK